jgi:hypothetical protein
MVTHPVMVVMVPVMRVVRMMAVMVPMVMVPAMAVMTVVAAVAVTARGGGLGGQAPHQNCCSQGQHRQASHGGKHGSYLRMILYSLVVGGRCSPSAITSESDAHQGPRKIDRNCTTEPLSNAGNK